MLKRSRNSQTGNRFLMVDKTDDKEGGICASYLDFIRQNAARLMNI